MYRASWKKLVAAVSRIAACGILFSAATKPACADDAGQGVIRTFAVSVNSLEQVPDFFGDQSVALVVAPGRPMQADVILQFADSNCDERFNSTVWVRQDAMHITTDGTGIPGGVYWLLTSETPEPPPIGAITFSGPDSPLICSQEDPVYYESFGTGYRVRCSPGGAGLLLVVTAVFSR
jgi:hypothetical protein